MRTKLFTLLFAMLVASVMMADAEIIKRVQIGSFYYNLDTDNKTAEVTNGTTNVSQSVYPNLVSANIPESITYQGDTYSVTSIGAHAFNDCSSLTYVTIPESVTTIGYGAFFSCKELKSVNLPNSVVNIGDDVFKYCDKLNRAVYNTHIFAHLPQTYSVEYTIPNGIEIIAGGAFYNCQEVPSIIMPNSVTRIGSSVFYGCRNLKSIIMSTNVDTIGNSAFMHCNSLTSIVIPENVTSIGVATFFNCYNLSSIYLGRNVTSIEKQAFYCCYHVNEIHYLGSIDEWYFKLWSTSQISSSYDLFIGDVKVTNFELPDGLTSIEEDILGGCTSMISVSIPNSVTSIGEGAFSGCTGLTSIEIPNSVTNIGNNAFSICSALTSLEIPYGVDSIRNRTFYGCTNLTSVTIPNSVVSIGDGVFEGCSSLKAIAIPHSVTNIGNDAFSHCESLKSIVWNIARYDKQNPFDELRGQITSFTFGEKVVYIPNQFCKSMSSLTSITIPNSVKEIGDYAFCDCAGLRTVIMGSQVHSIGAHAFENCTRVYTLNLPNTLTYIGTDAFKNTAFITEGGEWEDGIHYINTCIVGSKPSDILTEPILREGTTAIYQEAFKNCDRIVSINLPKITNIPNDAFFGCTSLTSIEIPNSVKSIGTSVFEDCKRLVAITIPDSVASIGIKAFKNCSQLKSIIWNARKCEIQMEYIPSTTDGKYNDFFSGIRSRITSFTFGSNVEEIPAWLCYGMINLDSISIPNSVVNIGAEAFRACSLTSINIPNSVTSIGKNAFLYCNDLISVKIGNSVTNIGGSAFENCSSLTSIEIPNSVTSIGEYAFSGCSSLKEITLGHAVETIGDNAFDQCPNVMTIYSYLETPPAINSTVFAGFGTYKGVDLYIPEGAKANYEAMYYWKDFYIIEGLPDIIDNKLHYTLNEETQTATLITSSLAELKPVIDGELIIPDTVVSNGKIYVVTAIGNNVFKDNSTITTVVIPSTVTQIGDSAFYGSSITSVVIGGTEVPAPNNTATRRIVREGICCSIGAYAFANCKKLTEINFPECVSAIGEGAFKDCSALTTINSKMQNPPVIDETVFEGCGDLGNIALMVPEGSEESYKNLAVWKEFLLNTSLKTYTIIFVNWDGAELLKLADVQEGTLPVYTAELPTRPEDDEFTYSFIGWTPEIVPASEDATYTAAYETTPKAEGIKDVYIDNIVTQKLLRDGQIFILRGDKTYTLQGQEVK